MDFLAPTNLAKTPTMGKHHHHPSNGNNNKNASGFRSLGLSEEVYRGIARLGYRTPTPVQRKALPVLLTGVDTVVMARTGSGKTAAFLIPLAEQLLLQQNTATPTKAVRAVILSPTRELSQQTLKVWNKLSPTIPAIGIHGGATIEHQFSLLASKPDVIVATPGRLAHHVTEIPDFSLHSVQCLVLDEADRLLEQGLAEQIQQIHRTIPGSGCQRILVSATLPQVLIHFTKTGFCSTDPAVIRLDTDTFVSTELRLAFVTCRSANKDAALVHVVERILQPDTAAHRDVRTGLTLIFCATRHHVEYVAALLDTVLGNHADSMTQQQQPQQKVTMLYGSMDPHARIQNLQRFRNGTHPILVVTDVAARGIDVPLIDHVIHYQFPPTPKLFVHRSGRAARAGRLGYCWALVEPDELPYMMDLHVFLGRQPETSEQPYTLETMTPDMVHYGSVPESMTEIETVARLLQSELTGTEAAATLRSLTKVCSNAMQQYRKSRPEASRHGVQRAKAVLEGKKLATGQRVATQAAIPPHPLLLASSASSGGAQQQQQQKKRHDWLQAVANYRPKETVLEAAVGKPREQGVVSHIDKGRTAASASQNRLDTSLLAMQHMRRQMRMVRDRGLIVAGSGTVAVQEGAEETAELVLEEEQHIPSAAASTVEKLMHQPKQPTETKRRLSKAERKRQKQHPNSTVLSNPTTCVTNSSDATTIAMKTSFRDPQFYIDHGTAASTTIEQQKHAACVEAAMHSRTSEPSQAVRLEQAMLEVVGDETDQLVKKQRMMRWDKAKRKYVQTTVGEELRGDSKTKKIRLESGQLVRGDKLRLGDLYQKWQKKTQRSVGRSGVFDSEADAPDDRPAVPAAAPKGKKGQGDKRGKRNGRPKSTEKKELKSLTDIRKGREQKQNDKMRNMNRNDRRKAMAGQQQQNSKGGKRRK